MILILLAAGIAVAALWWFRGEQALSRNERLYLRRRGYHFEDGQEQGPPLAFDTRLISLIQSLEDLSPYSRQKAAEDLSRLCASGRRDPRMLSSLVAALGDSDPGVRSAAALALGNLGDERARESLERAVENDNSILVRASARKALEKLGAGRKVKDVSNPPRAIESRDFS